MKAALGLALTAFGLDVVLSEVDAVWMQNPAELLEQCALASPQPPSGLCTPCHAGGALRLDSACCCAVALIDAARRPTAAAAWVTL